MQPGNARAKECLEDSREKEGFSKPCLEELEKMMAARAADFRLDPKLRQLCARDIQARARRALCSCRAGRPPPQGASELCCCGRVCLSQAAWRWLASSLPATWWQFGLRATALPVPPGQQCECPHKE